MKLRYRQPIRMLLAAAVLVAPEVYAKDKTSKPDPKDTIEVVGHVSVSSSPVVRFESTQHYSSYYLYAEHGSGANVTLIDVTKAAHPVLLSDAPYTPDAKAQTLLVVAGTAALVDSDNSAASVTPKTQTLRIMDFSDAQHPKVAREFAGVTAVGRDDSRGLVFVANPDGIWILQKHLAEDPAVVKAYDDYILYNR